MWRLEVYAQPGDPVFPTIPGGLLTHSSLSLSWPSSTDQSYPRNMCDYIEMWGVTIKQKDVRIKHTWKSLWVPYCHACCVKTPLCLYSWPAPCADSVHVLGLLIFVFLSLRCTPERRGCFISAHRCDYSISLHPNFSHIFVFIHTFNRWAESGAVLGSGVQLAERRWQVRCSCRLLCQRHGDQLWSISVRGRLPGTMQASQ